MHSKFNEDLSKEVALGQYLDTIYPIVFEGCVIQRITDNALQHQGVDLIISKEGRDFYIDEKAQLDYLDKNLPTFAFEISYLKNGKEHLGWLFDESKLSQRYFLVTGIFLNNPQNFNEGFKSCAILSVDRVKLLKLLNSMGLNAQTVVEINSNIRSSTLEKAIPIKELNAYTQGRFYYSKSNKSEQPINLVLYLDFLIQSKVAKKIV